MVIDQVEIWQLVLGASGVVVTTILGVAGLLVRLRADEETREAARQERADARLGQLQAAITAGDVDARQKAHNQIEGLRQDVRSEVAAMRGRVDQVDQRMDAVEKEVAAMPTRAQLDALFLELRRSIESSTRTLSERIDRIHDGARADGSGR